MGGKKYTQEQVDWIGCNFATYPTTKTLTEAFNLQFGESRTESSVAQTATRRCGLKRWPRQCFTEKENAWLIENYSKMKAELLTEKFCAKFGHNCKPRTIIGHCNDILGIQSGRKNFPKGNTPWKVCDIGQEKKGSNGYTLVKISDKKRQGKVRTGTIIGSLSISLFGNNIMEKCQKITWLFFWMEIKRIFPSKI